MIERQLPAVWAVEHAGEQVPDVEYLCAAVVVEVARRWQAPLEHSEREDGLRFLLGQVVVLLHPSNERIYDPAKGGTRGGNLRGWLYNELRLDLIDYWRGYNGRRGQKRVFDERGWQDDDGGDPPARRLDSGAAEDPGFATADGDGLGGLLAARDRATLREERRLGLHPDGRAARLADRAPARPGRPALGRAARLPGGAAAFVDCECGWRTYPQPPNGVNRWHLPEQCLGCGAAIASGSASSRVAKQEASNRPNARAAA